MSIRRVIIVEDETAAVVNLRSMLQNIKPEIEIIANHQDASDAMATVMTGWAYYCSYNVINGEVVYYQTTGKSGSNKAVRCVRDAY